MTGRPTPNAFDREPAWDPQRFPPASSAPRALQSLRLAREPLRFTMQLRAELGPVFSMRIFPYRGGFVCAATPDTVREVLTDQRRFVGGDAAVLLEPLVGASSLILTPPPRHLRNRKLLLPPFHGERVARWSARVLELVQGEVGALASGRPVAVRPWAQRLTLDVILRVVFGLRRPERVRAFREALDAYMSPRLSPLLFAPAAIRADHGPWSPGGVFARRRVAVDALIRAELADRRAGAERDEDDDVLSVLLAARDENGHGFTDDELRDELLGLVLAGHETTATALAWTLHLLAHTPEARDALVDDLDGGGDGMLKAVVKESLRLRPPVFDAVRTAAEDTELGGHPVPKDAFLSALFCAMHVDPELWPDPHAFRPERHLDDRSAPYSWTPFGGGVRRCIGASLAQLELEIVVREVLRHALPEPAGEYEAPRLHAVTIIPARGGRVVLRRRDASSRRAADEARRDRAARGPAAQAPTAA